MDDARKEELIKDPNCAYILIMQKSIRQGDPLFEKAMESLCKLPRLMETQYFDILCKAIATSPQASRNLFISFRYKVLPRTKWTDTILRAACSNHASRAAEVLDTVACRSEITWYRYAAEIAFTNPNMLRPLIVQSIISYEMDAEIYERAMVAVLKSNLRGGLPLMVQQGRVFAKDKELYKRILKVIAECGDYFPKAMLRDCLFLDAISGNCKEYKKLVINLFKEYTGK